MFEPFDRAWRRVGLALDRVGFTVEDRDRQKGQYFVRYADADAEMNRKDAEKPGLLSKLAFWKPSEPNVKAEQYRVHIRQFAGKSVVQILNKDGEAHAFTITAAGVAGIQAEYGSDTVTVAPGEVRGVPVRIRVPRGELRGGTDIQLTIRTEGDRVLEATGKARFLAPTN